MSNSTVSSISSTAQPNTGTRFAALQNTPRSHGRDDDREGGSQGLSLFSALLQALVSAASQANAASATTPTSSSTATSSTTAASSAGNTTTTATTPPSTASNSLPQDLGAFLHDLFHALRHAGRQESEGRHLEPLSSATSGTTATTGTTTTTGTTATTGATATTGTTATAAGSGSTSSTATGDVAVNSYRDHGVIGALQQLIKDLTNSQVVSGASTGTAAPGLSQNVVSNLNSAFQRLLADLGSTSSTSGSQSDTTALKSFLQGFLQDLQGGNTSSGTGNVINAAA
jgi:hypothetical protein